MPAQLGSKEREWIMYGTNIREIIEEEQEIQRHKEALDTLVHVRSKLLRESLEARMRRARDHREWHNLSPEESAEQHQEEKRYLKSQIARLRHEQARTKGQLTELRRVKTLAIVVRAAAVASEQNGH